VVTADRVYNQISVNKSTLYASTGVQVSKFPIAQCLNAGSVMIKTYVSDHELMLKNNDPNSPATWENPGNYQRIEKVTYENDPRLVDARVQNFIVGVTGNETTGTTTSGVNQFWSS
jgi:hypothetical protein